MYVYTSGNPSYTVLSGVTVRINDITLENDQFDSFDLEKGFIKIKPTITNSDLKIGDILEFSFSIAATTKEKLMVDYKITYPTPTSRMSEKVFKLKKLNIRKGQELKLKKKHKLKKTSTKVLYSGEYKVGIQVNGKILAEAKFNLEV